MLQTRNFRHGIDERPVPFTPVVAAAAAGRRQTQRVQTAAAVVVVAAAVVMVVEMMGRSGGSGRGSRSRLVEQRRADALEVRRRHVDQPVRIELCVAQTQRESRVSGRCGRVFRLARRAARFSTPPLNNFAVSKV